MGWRMIEKGYFFIEMNEKEVLDMASLSPTQWRDVQKRAEHILLAKQTKNEKIAFVAGFLNFVSEMQAMQKPFGNDQH